MKILFLPQTCELGPSSRYRVYQLLDLLRQNGLECDVSPAIDTALYQQLYLGTPPAGARRRAFQAIWRQRKTDLNRLNGYDAVFVQKAFFPGLYAGLELAIASRKPLVVDLDDAIWLPRQGGNRWLRGLHRESAVQKILSQAASVTAGNEFIAGYARQFNPNVTIVPSVIDTARYPPATSAPVVGWIGSRTTLPYLKPLAEVFQQLNITPRVIAAGDPATLGFNVEFRQWNLATEFAELAQIGIGIAPLPDTPWENGKCGVKLLQYMACGMSVIASPVGVHRDIVQHGVNGFLATTPAEWRAFVEKLIGDESLRKRLGAAGRTTVVNHYDIRTAAARVTKVLQASAQTHGMTNKLNRMSA